MVVVLASAERAQPPQSKVKTTHASLPPTTKHTHTPKHHHHQQQATSTATSSSSASRPVLVALLLCPDGFTPPPPPQTPPDTQDSTPTTTPSPFGSGGGRSFPSFSSASSTPDQHQQQQQHQAITAFGTAGGRCFALLSLRLEDLILVTSRRRKQRVDSEAILAAGMALMVRGGEGRGVGVGSAVGEVVEELVRCEREEAKAGDGGGLEALDFRKELKINDLAFVEEYGRWVFGG